MRYASPLRYPGGKSAVAGLLAEVRRENRLGSTTVAEPFAGGAGAALRLLFREEAPEILINDLDLAIHDFWWTLVNRPEPFLRMLSEVDVTIDEWRRQRAVHRRGGRVPRLRRGFAAFYLNRCNRSGIIRKGGPIGGLHQSGRWKLDARFNKDALLDRCRRIVEYADRIRVSQMDGLDFIRQCDPSDTFLFIDPPYYVKGPTLYLNSLDADYHAALADQLRGMDDAAWVLTYDDSPDVRRLYSGWTQVRSLSLNYSASGRTHARELLIAPPWMQFPPHDLLV